LRVNETGMSSFDQRNFNSGSGGQALLPSSKRGSLERSSFYSIVSCVMSLPSDLGPSLGGFAWHNNLNSVAEWLK
jgi:hypothetical protein